MSACIRLYYNKTQDGKGVDATMNTECDVIKASHSGTIE